MPEISQEALNAANELKTRLCQIVPVHLISNDILERIWNVSQRLLHEAIDQGACIEDIHMDQSGLISWSGRIWDPDSQTLHSTLQERLEEHTAVEELGSMIRDSVVRLGNQRLDDARRLAVALEKLYIDDDLLPNWISPSSSPSIPEPSEDLDMSASISQSQCFVENTEVDKDGDIAAMLPTDLTCGGSRRNSLSSLFSSMLSNNDVGSDGDVDFDDVVSLRNFVEDSSSVKDFEGEDIDEPPNVVHDVDVVGADGNVSLDFELYLAQENGELEEMLEIEMAIDKDGFEEYCDKTNEGVDLEIEDRDIFCSIPDANNEDSESPEENELIVIQDEPADSTDWMFI